VLRALPDRFVPHLELGTSAQKLSIVPLLAVAVIVSKPERVDQRPQARATVRERTTCDGIFFSAISSRSPFLARKTSPKKSGDARSVSSPRTLDEATHPFSRRRQITVADKVAKLRQSRASHFYLRIVTGPKHSQPIPRHRLKSRFTPVAEIVAFPTKRRSCPELNDVQGVAMDLARLLFPRCPSVYPRRCVPAPR